MKKLNCWALGRAGALVRGEMVPEQRRLGRNSEGSAVSTEERVGQVSLRETGLCATAAAEDSRETRRTPRPSGHRPCGNPSQLLHADTGKERWPSPPDHPGLPAVSRGHAKHSPLRCGWRSRGGAWSTFPQRFGQTVEMTAFDRAR